MTETSLPVAIAVSTWSLCYNIKAPLAYFLQREALSSVFFQLNLKIIQQDHAIKKIYCKNSKSTTSITGAVPNLVRDVKEHLTQVFKGDGN